MYLKLFEKYIDFSNPKHKFIKKNLKGIKKFDDALKFVASKMFLTNSLIEKLKADSTTYNEEEADKIEENQDKQEEALDNAKETLEEIKKENDEQGKKARLQY